MAGTIHKRPELLLSALLLSVSLIGACCLGEVALRYFMKERLIVYQDERNLLYRYESQLGWFPRENIVTTFTGERTVSITHNSRGFRDIEHYKSAKPGILFLGDSFVWGYDVEAAERFTDVLQHRIPGWEIFNLGISGYSTDQELMLLMDQFDYYQPRIVVLVICSYNDFIDNSHNYIFDGRYYKPYYVIDNQRLVLQGTPVPGSLVYFSRQHPWLAKSYLVRLVVKAIAHPLVEVENPTAAIITAMHAFVRQKGSRLLVALESPNFYIETVLRKEQIPYLQLSGAERYSGLGWHWTPAGHTTVSDRIYEFLLTQGLTVHANQKHR